MERGHQVEYFLHADGNELKTLSGYICIDQEKQQNGNSALQVGKAKGDCSSTPKLHFVLPLSDTIQFQSSDCQWLRLLRLFMGNSPAWIPPFVQRKSMKDSSSVLILLPAAIS